MILKSIYFSPESESLLRAVRSDDISKYDMDVEAVSKLLMLIRQTVDEKASDVHLRVDSPPRLRIDGELYKIKGFVPSEEDLRRFCQRMLSSEQFKIFEDTHELDFSHSVEGTCRIRVNLYVERGKFCGSIRLIPKQIPTMEDLMMSRACERLVGLHGGLVLVTGPTESGPFPACIIT